MANVRGLMIIAIVLFIGAVQAPNPQHTVDQEKQSTTDVTKVSNTKGPSCHHPFIINCNTSIYQIRDWKLSGWYYHSLFKSCQPVYSSKGIHICPENQDLPKTREMCEDLCGESCIMSNGSTGICTFGPMCKIINNRASAHPRPCRSYDVNCCPKVIDSDLVPFENSGEEHYLNAEFKHYIHFTDKASPQNGTFYIYNFPNFHHAKGKSN